MWVWGIEKLAGSARRRRQRFGEQTSAVVVPWFKSSAEGVVVVAQRRVGQRSRGYAKVMVVVDFELAKARTDGTGRRWVGSASRWRKASEWGSGLGGDTAERLARGAVSGDGRRSDAPVSAVTCDSLPLVTGIVHAISPLQRKPNSGLVTSKTRQNGNCFAYWLRMDPNVLILPIFNAQTADNLSWTAPWPQAANTIGLPAPSIARPKCQISYVRLCLESVQAHPALSTRPSLAAETIHVGSVACPSCSPTALCCG